MRGARRLELTLTHAFSLPCHPRPPSLSPKMSPVLHPSIVKLVNQPRVRTAPASSSNTLAAPSLARFTVYHQKRWALP
ncbi:hypothetical protein LEMLEM_LOCUS27693, partial [Lemmus lemmus]